MKSGWVENKLGFFVNDFIVPQRDKPKYFDGNTPWCRIEDIDDIYLSKSKSNSFVSKKTITEMNLRVYPVNTVIVSCSADLGRCAIIKTPLVTNQTFIGLVPSSKIVPLFLYYYMTSISKKLNAMATGATIKYLSKDKFRNLNVCFPPLPEQKRIVTILDEAFAAIAKAKENAEKNLQNAKEIFESYLQSVFGNRNWEIENGEWEERKLREVCEIKPQKKEARDKLKETDSVTFLPMEDLGVLNKIIVGVRERKLKDVEGSYTYFANGDVLLAKITPCFENGKIGIAHNLINGIGFGSSEYIVFRSLGYVIVDYLYYFLSRRQFREEGKNLMNGAVGHKRVSKEWVENYLIPFPKSLKTQHLITEKFDALSSEINNLEALYKQKLFDLEELKKSILQKAFNGELNTTKKLEAL
ncbi:MAG: restriction endonuclease subunit S [Flavobacterium sp.]|nr:restriction endonuclease subunit S [Flavobacterium sp.]